MYATAEQTEKITKIILNEFQDIIAVDTNKPNVTHLIEFEIDTGDHSPICTKPRSFHPDLERRIQQRLDEMCHNGLMEKIDFSQWSSNVRPVNKPDGSIRVCGNYVALNKITTSIQYPFINMHEALQNREKTALVTKSGFYVFNVMSMGLKNAPMVFQYLMDKTLGVYRFVFCIAYLDDLIIYSPDLDTHIHIKLVLERLRFANLSINLSKCQWVLPKVEYLGFIITAEGIQGNPEKVKPIIEYPVPESLKDLEQFLGMAGVYQRFIGQYQLKAEPLRRLKKKDAEFKWTAEQQEAFEIIKKDLCLLPTLKQPNFAMTFEIHSDAAFKVGIAVILCQRYNDTPYPLAFASRSLTSNEKNYSVQELECLAVVFGIKKFRQFLECGFFLVYTDHSSLQWVLNTKEDKQARIWRWCMFLQAFDFQVIYVPGHTNKAADALSRHPLPPGLQAMDTVVEQCLIITDIE
ncbi:hypothetical protein G6F31_013594 [Rhizopus arrhizus]|nr:hypothetical protein G6F31_013594 [Rhizopus arrhizus]